MGRAPLVVMIGLWGCDASRAGGEAPGAACGVGRPCPEGLVCGDDGQCGAPRDTVAPAIVGPVSVEPDAGARGARFTVRFSVSEPLAAPPEVAVDLGEHLVALGRSGPGAEPYEFTYLSSGAEPEGPAPLAIRLVDASGIESTNTSAALVFDHTPPDVLGHSLSPSVAGVGTRITCTLDVSEALPRPPTLVASTEAGRIGLAVALQDGPSYSFAYLVTPEDTEGTYRLSATLEDHAGNTRTVALETEARLDTTPATVLAGSVELDGDRLLGDGETRTVSFEASEPLLAPPTVRLGGDSLAPVREPAAPRYAFSYHSAGRPGDDRTLPLVVELVDAAGNRSVDAAALGALTLDFTPPLFGTELSPEVTGLATEQVEVAVHVSEPLAPGSVLVEMRALPDGPWQRFGQARPLGSRYLATLRLRDDLASGRYGLRVGLEDLAGNAVREELPWTLVVDLEPPRVLAGPDDPDGPSVGPWRRLGARDLLTVELSVSEPLAAPPTLRLDGAPLGELAGVDPERLRYTFTHDVEGEPGDDREGPIVVELTDPAGNRTRDTTSLGRIALDFTPPTASFSLVPSLANADVEEVFVTVVPSEPLAPWSPRLEWRRLPDGDWVVLACQERGGLETEGPACVAFLDVTEGVADGTYAFRLEIEDEVGNVTAALEPEPQLWVERTRPMVVDASILPDRSLREDDLLTVTIHVSERLLARPWVSLFGRLMREEEADPAAQRYEFSYSLEDWDAWEGPFLVEARLVDLALNANWVQLGGVTLDFTPPGLVSTSLHRCDRRDAARLAADDLWLGRVDCPEGEPALTVSFGLTEPVEPPEVHLAGRPLLLAAPRDNPLYHLATYEPAGDEPESSPQAPEGLTVVADVRDEAGNEARLELGTVHFDLTPPQWGTDEAALLRATHLRDPWGSEGSGYLPRAEVRLEADALDEPAEVRVWAVDDGAVAGADPQGELYARSLLGADLFWPGEALTVAIGSADHAPVHLTWTDLAGNESDADPVRGGIQAEPVAAQEWIATLGGGLAGDPASSPHELLVAAPPTDPGPPALDVVETWPAADDARGGAARRADGSLARASAAGGAWARAPGSEGPSPRYGGALAYDAGRARTVLFGGVSVPWSDCGVEASNTCDDTWEWDGRWWTRRRPAHRPPARHGHSLAYDEERGRVVLFGGQGRDHFPSDDTWEWDGYDWVERRPPQSPAAREAAALAYDAGRRRVVLFGGRTTEPGACGEDGSSCSDTWEWDGATWALREPEHAPEARYGSSLTYDAARQRLVLFGGLATEGACEDPSGAPRCDDTWEWDGDDWLPREPAHRPPWRAGPELAYDPLRGETVLFGGGGPSEGSCGSAESSSCSDTWVWDGEDWAPREPGETPPARTYHGLAYDDARGRVVLFGGFGTGIGTCDAGEAASCSDTWEWDGVTWTRRDSSVSPGAVTGHALAHDATRRRTVLFGGCAGWFGRFGWGGWDGWGGSCRYFRSWTWEWDGAVWRSLVPALAPPARWGHTLTWDAGEVALTGGKGSAAGACDGGGGWHCSDGWVWDGRSWTPRAPAAGPPPRSSHATAHDTRRGVTVLFGGLAEQLWSWGEGRYFSDTWESDGATWVLRDPAEAPAPRVGHALAYDERRGVAVLFGGWGAEEGSCGPARSRWCSDTWEWDGDVWIEREPRTAPSPRFDHVLAYHPARGVVVLFGGDSEDPAGCGARHGRLCADTWEWDGVDWARRPVGTSPPGRCRAAIAHDADRDELVLFGGFGGAEGACGTRYLSLCSDTWLYGSPQASPHLVAAFGARGALASTAGDPSNKALHHLVLTARAGGAGHTAGGEPVLGFSARVAAFGAGGWVPLHVSGPAGPEQPEEWTGRFESGWSCGEPRCSEAVIDRWFDADDRLLLDLTPLEAQGASGADAEVVLDYLELRLRTWRTGCEPPHPGRPLGTPDGTPCHDGLPETQGETCQQWECVAP